MGQIANLTGFRGLKTIDRRMDTDRIDRMGGALLLFEGGGRPDLQSIRDATSKLPHIAISLDPAGAGRQPDLPSARQPDGSPDKLDTHWLELLCNGLTFDLIGLAPGRALDAPEIRHLLDLPEGFTTSSLDAVSLLPGPHLSGGINSLPVVRIMLGLIADIVSDLQFLRGIFWPPAGILIGPALFRANARSWIDGGPFPAQALTGIRQMSDGSLQTDGLAFFTGQEIRIEPDSVGDYPTAAQLVNRLVQQLVQHGPLTQAEEVMAPDGSLMRLEPSGNRKFVRVWRS